MRAALRVVLRVVVLCRVACCVACCGAWWCVVVRVMRGEVHTSLRFKQESAR